MTKIENGKNQPFQIEEMDLSKLTPEELRKLKELILTRSGMPIPPTEMTPMAMTTDDRFFDPFAQIGRPVESIIRIISLIFRRLSLAVLTTGFALTTGILAQKESSYADLFLAATGVSAAWFVLDMLRTGSNRK